MPSGGALGTGGAALAIALADVLADAVGAGSTIAIDALGAAVAASLVIGADGFGDVEHALKRTKLNEIEARHI